MKKIIHVNQNNIKYNIKNKDKKKVITVKTYKSNEYANELEINGPCKIIYRPNQPLSCGARLWIETESEIIFKD